jgi:deazaflavin-dependent oxidoreductase (nitroreductase family)
VSADQNPDHPAAVKWSSRGNTRWIVVRGPWGRRFDRALVRSTGFSLITWQYAKAGGNPYQPTLLLTTIGRHSGQRRERALPYYEIDGAFVVVGSNGGGPKDPDWAHNVRANSAAWVCVKRHWHAVHAHEADGDERVQVAAAIHAQRDSLARYEERAATFGRRVPLIVLRPR